MKRTLIAICCLLSLLTTFAEAKERRFLIPPFENFSQYKSKTDYEITFNDANDPSKLVKRHFKIDQYSEAARSILENKILKMNIKIIERLRVDQMLNESKLTNQNGFVNKESAIEMGKIVGADTLIMGTILNIQSREEEIKVYGIKQKSISTICTIRIRIINIESGNVFFSDENKGKSVDFSSEYGNIKDSDPAYVALENAIDLLVNSDHFQTTVSSLKLD